MLKIELEYGNTNFTPGEKLKGTVSWQLESTQEPLEVHLLWRTSGKGTEDIKVVESLTVDLTGTQGDHEFEISMPAGPYSFDGPIISLEWVIEAVCGDEVSEQGIQLSLTGYPVAMKEVEDPEAFKFKKKNKWGKMRDYTQLGK